MATQVASEASEGTMATTASASPSKRREMDVTKLCAAARAPAKRSLAPTSPTRGAGRARVRARAQHDERLQGRARRRKHQQHVRHLPRPSRLAVRRRHVEGARPAAGRLPVQVAVDRLLQPDVPPERGRDVRPALAPLPPSQSLRRAAACDPVAVRAFPPAHQRSLIRRRVCTGVCVRVAGRGRCVST